jgi:hypothetical protein
MAAWHANLGAVEMARIELADFPSGQWEDGKGAALLAPAEGYFLQALAYNPEQPHRQSPPGIDRHAAA